jgi:hypothetical protein
MQQDVAANHPVQLRQFANAIDTGKRLGGNCLQIGANAANRIERDRRHNRSQQHQKRACE